MHCSEEMEILSSLREKTFISRSHHVQSDRSVLIIDALFPTSFGHMVLTVVRSELIFFSLVVCMFMSTLNLFIRLLSIFKQYNTA